MRVGIKKAGAQKAAETILIKTCPQYQKERKTLCHLVKIKPDPQEKAPAQGPARVVEKAETQARGQAKRQAGSGVLANAC